MNVMDSPEINVHVTIEETEKTVMEVIAECGQVKKTVEMEILSDGQRRSFDLSENRA